MAQHEKELDASSLKALAHPIRTQMLRILELGRPVSVTSLAEQLGETTGATSYHLRQLARHGFVEQCPNGGPLPDGAAAPATGRRQRWWQIAVDDIHLSGFDFLADPTTRSAAQFVISDAQADRSRRAAYWHTSATEWSRQWQRASSDADRRLLLDPLQTRALADELKALLTRYAELEPGPGARSVDVQYAVFPSETGERA